MNFTQVIGVSASIFTATSLIPQLCKQLKEKQAQDISVVTLLILSIGLSLWTWYGFLIKDWILVASNGFSLLVNGLVAVLNFNYKNKST